MLLLGSHRRLGALERPHQVGDVRDSWGPGPLGPRPGGVGAWVAPHKRLPTEMYRLSESNLTCDGLLAAV